MRFRQEGRFVRIGSVPDAAPPTAKVSEPRERLLRTATRLFYEEGIHGVGVDRVLAEAGVARAAMYRHFPGKEALVVAYLEHEDAVIRGLFATAAEEAAARDAAPAELLALVIDGVAEDATRLHTRGCPFINASAEFPDADGPVRAVVRRASSVVPGNPRRPSRPRPDRPIPPPPPRRAWCCCATPCSSATTSTARTSRPTSARPPARSPDSTS